MSRRIATFAIAFSIALAGAAVVRVYGGEKRDSCLDCVDEYCGAVGCRCDSAFDCYEGLKCSDNCCTKDTQSSAKQRRRGVASGAK